MRRNQALDVLRGIAILLVISFHYRWCHFLWHVGWTGVDLFFVLSGFLVSGLLFDEYKRSGRIEIVRFWIRRGFKIYPPFYLLMSITVASFWIVGKHQFHLVWPEFLFLQSYVPHVWPHTWSLAVEEHFYFTLPLILIVLIRLGTKSRPLGFVPWACIVFMVACPIMRYMAYVHGANPATVHSESHLRVDSLFAGVLLSYWHRFHRERFTRLASRPLYLLAVPLLVPAVILPPSGEFMNTAGLTFVYLAFALVLTCSVSLAPSRALPIRALAWTGRYSYSIYLWHLPLWAVFYRGHFGIGFSVLGGTASIIFGAAMSRLIEAPSLQIRENILPRYAQSRLPAAVHYLSETTVLSPEQARARFPATGL